MPTPPTPKSVTKVPNRKPQEWQPVFLDALRDSANVRYACQRARIDRTTAYAYRRRSSTFAAAWEAALNEAADILEFEARRRAVTGVREERYLIGGGKILHDNNGNPLTEVTTRYSDTLLIFLLKGARPEKYADRARIDVHHVLEQAADELAREFGLSSDGRAKLIDLASRRQTG